MNKRMSFIEKLRLFAIYFICAAAVFVSSPYAELALAQPDSSPNGNGENSSLVLQILGGFVGGLLAGYLGYELYIHYLICARPLSPDSVLLNPEEIEVCKSLFRGSNRGTLYPVFIFAGSAFGIMAVSLMMNMPGNYIAMTIGTLSGAFSGAAIWSDFVWNIIRYLSNPTRIEELEQDENTPVYWLRVARAFAAFVDTNIDEFEENIKFYVPIIIAALFGVIGFNIGV